MKSPLDKLIVDGEVKEGDTVRVEARGDALLLHNKRREVSLARGTGNPPT